MGRVFEHSGAKKKRKDNKGKWNELRRNYFAPDLTKMGTNSPAPVMKKGTCSCSGSSKVGVSFGCFIAPPEQLLITDSGYFSFTSYFLFLSFVYNLLVSVVKRS